MSSHIADPSSRAVPSLADHRETDGPQLLSNISNETDRKIFKVDDVAEMGDIGTKISANLCNEYVLGYRSDDEKRDGKWRKLNVKLAPPPGLPPLAIHARNGYYAPLQ